jgi:hypothetical protein
MQEVNNKSKLQGKILEKAVRIFPALYITPSQQTFRRNISPPSSGSKNKPSKGSSVKAGGNQTWFLA